jgi:hypothetical protein
MSEQNLDKTHIDILPPARIRRVKRRPLIIFSRRPSRGRTIVALLIQAMASAPVGSDAEDGRLSRTRGRNRGGLFGEYLEASEFARTERGHDRNVGGVAPARH